MFLRETMRLKSGFRKVKSVTAGFLNEYWGDIEGVLKKIGAGAAIIFIVKILKDFVLKNEKGKAEIQKLLDEIEKEQKITGEIAEKIEELSNKYPVLEKGLKKAIQEFADQKLEEQRKLTKKIEEADLIWFATSDFVDKSDKEEIIRIQKEMTMALYGMGEVGEIAQKIDPEYINDEKTKNAYLTLQDFCEKYCSSIDEVYLDDNKLLDEDKTDTDWLGYFVVEEGVHFNFNETIEVTDELRKTFDSVLDALNILVAKNPDDGIKRKFYNEYFLE